VVLSPAVSRAAAAPLIVASRDIQRDSIRERPRSRRAERAGAVQADASGYSNGRLFTTETISADELGVMVRGIGTQVAA
jgi:hypothetical protein